jgi:molybdopterin/thiamine biosynthesis adenylyltransferase
MATALYEDQGPVTTSNGSVGSSGEIAADTGLRNLAGRAVKVIGLGGVGAPLAQALTQFLAWGRAATTLFLIDGDAYEEKNRERVLFQGFGNKAVSKVEELTAICDGALSIVPVPKYVTPRNVSRTVQEGDIVFLAVDNHATRRLVSKRCGKLRDVALFSGGNDGIDTGRDGTFGNVIVYIRGGGRDLTNPLTRFHPEIARPKDKRPDELGCAELAQSAPQLLFTNLAVASTMLAAFHAWLAGKLHYEEIYLDIAQCRMNSVRRTRKGL